MAVTDPHMISDAALNARYSDADAVRALMEDEETRSMYERCRDTKPDRLPSLLLAFKRGLYRQSDEYQRDELAAQMKRKPRPSARPMAGHGSNAYRTWSR